MKVADSSSNTPAKHARDFGQRRRLISLAELAAGSAIVIAHNIFRTVPNEVLLLFPFALLSVWHREGWRMNGLRRPDSWKKTVLIGIAVAALLQLEGFVTEPLASWIWGKPVEAPGLISEAMTLKGLVLLFLLIWTFAAFGEEIVYRGYLLNRASDTGRRSTAADWVAVFYISLLFALAHWYKGAPGMLDSGASGLILGGAYIFTRRNLWVPILGHGFSNSAAAVGVYLGLIKI